MSSDPIPVPPPIEAKPWYRSPVVVGVTTAVVTQVVNRVQQKYQLNIEAFGFTINDLVGFVLDAISGVAAYVAIHSRVTSPHAPVTLTQRKADAVNNPQS